MMRRFCRFLGLILALAVTIAQAVAAERRFLSQQLLDEGWIELFDGETLAGWERTGEAEWTVVDGTIVTKGEKSGWLMTRSEWADFELHVEFKSPAATNSGIFLRTALEPTDPTKDCYELNIAPQDNPFPTGSLVGRRKSPKPLAVWDGKWHAFEITADGSTFSIYCDDNLVLRYDDPSPIGRGHVGLQAKEGEVAFRNIRVREIRGE
jgi:hypothetical protein